MNIIPQIASAMQTVLTTVADISGHLNGSETSLAVALCKPWFSVGLPIPMLVLMS